MQTFRKLRPINARRAMTICTTMCGECLGAGWHAGGIVDGGGGLIVRITIDRSCTNFDQSPVDDRRIIGGAGDTIKAAEEKYRRADAENYRKRADRCQDAHIHLHPRPQSIGGKQYIAQYATYVTLS